LRTEPTLACRRPTCPPRRFDAEPCLFDPARLRARGFRRVFVFTAFLRVLVRLGLTGFATVGAVSLASSGVTARGRVRGGERAVSRDSVCFSGERASTSDGGG